MRARLPAVILASLLASALCEAAPCDQPEHRQFDFWIGRWDVTDHGKVIASSTIERFAGGCIVLESYAQQDGYSGKSINFYDASLHRWRQTWADSRGNASEWIGEWRDGALRFDGEAHRADGVKVTRNMTFTPLADGSVRQASDRSLDGGKTWQPGYDFVYVRKPQP
jgi:hypothetical protein